MYRVPTPHQLSRRSRLKPCMRRILGAAARPAGRPDIASPDRHHREEKLRRSSVTRVCVWKKDEHVLRGRRETGVRVREPGQVSSAVSISHLARMTSPAPPRPKFPRMILFRQRPNQSQLLSTCGLTCLVRTTVVGVFMIEREEESDPMRRSIIPFLISCWE